MSNLNDMDVDLLISTLASSDGDLFLAAERLDHKLGNERSTTNEYAIKERIANFDVQTADTLSSKLRALLTLKIYNLIIDMTAQLRDRMGDLKPSELVRAHSSMVASFATLTAPATKVTFDFDREVQELAKEFSIPIEDIRGELKAMDVKLKAVK
jgi:hypothetical protein